MTVMPASRYSVHVAFRAKPTLPGETLKRMNLMQDCQTLVSVLQPAPTIRELRGPTAFDMMVKHPEDIRRDRRNACSQGRALR